MNREDENYRVYEDEFKDLNAKLLQAIENGQPMVIQAKNTLVELAHIIPTFISHQKRIMSIIGIASRQFAMKALMDIQIGYNETVTIIMKSALEDKTKDAIKSCVHDLLNICIKWHHKISYDTLRECDIKCADHNMRNFINKLSTAFPGAENDHSQIDLSIEQTL